MARKYLTRRTWLRGALGGGVVASVGLPVLEAMLNTNGTALADGTPMPKRFATWFWGNGLVPGSAPSTRGPGWEPTPTLEGLRDVRQHIHVVSGTIVPRGRRTIEHLEGPIAVLTASNATAQDNRFDDYAYVTVSAPSIDEVAADFLGTPRFRSLVMAVTELHPAGPGAAVRYTSHRGPFAFNEPTFDPGRLFDRIFSGAPDAAPGRASDASRRAALRGRVVDTVREDASRLRGRLGPRDRMRLDQHLDQLRDLERRLAPSSPDGTRCTAPTRPGPVATDRERARQFAELTAYAFACDLTRVAAMEFSSPASHSPLPDIFRPDEVNGTFHQYQHDHGFDARVLRGFRYLMDCFGDFVRAFAAVPEGAGTLLDSTVIYATTDVANGHSHGMEDHPIFLAGHCGLPERGTHVRLEGGNPVRAGLTCLRALGWSEAGWGYDQLRATEPIAELLRPTRG